MEVKRKKSVLFPQDNAIKTEISQCLSKMLQDECKVISNKISVAITATLSEDSFLLAFFKIFDRLEKF
jgi:hypothetical protein